MFDSQTVETSKSPICGTNRSLLNKADNTYTYDKNAKIPDYFSFSTNRVVDKRASKVSNTCCTICMKGSLLTSFVLAILEDIFLVSVSW